MSDHGGDEPGTPRPPPRLAALTFTYPPPAPALLIEFPGYVRNPAVALAVLGGPESLAPAATAAAPGASHPGPRYITARLRPPCAPDGVADPLGHPLFSARRDKCAGVLVRVARPAGDPSAAPSITAVAGVTTSHHFPGLADVQYAAWDGRPAVEQAGRGGGSLGPLPGEPLLAVPPSFCRTDVPALAPGAVFGVPAPPPWSVPGPAPPAIAPHAAVVPRPAEGGAPGLVAAVVSGGGGGGGPGGAGDPVALVSALLAAFEARPVWAPGALGAAVAGALHGAVPAAGASGLSASLAPALARLTYRFASGPWAGTAVRRGYDPRADVAARAWQAVAVPGGGAAQLVDLAEGGDAQAQACLEGEAASTCDDEAGWCDAAAWAALAARREPAEEAM